MKPIAYPTITWKKVSATEWYGPSFGTVSKRADGWWGSNSVSPTVDIEPVIGPFKTAKEARYALGNAVIAAQGRALRKPEST